MSWHDKLMDEYLAEQDAFEERTAFEDLDRYGQRAYKRNYSRSVSLYAYYDDTLEEKEEEKEAEVLPPPPPPKALKPVTTHHALHCVRCHCLMEVCPSTSCPTNTKKPTRPGDAILFGVVKGDTTADDDGGYRCRQCDTTIPTLCCSSCGTEGRLLESGITGPDVVPLFHALCDRLAPTGATSIGSFDFLSVKGLTIDSSTTAVGTVVKDALLAATDDDVTSLPVSQFVNRFPFALSATCLTSPQAVQKVVPRDEKPRDLTYNLSTIVDKVAGQVLESKEQPAFLWDGIRVWGRPDGTFNKLPVEVKTVRTADDLKGEKVEQFLRQLAVYQNGASDTSGRPTGGLLVVIALDTGEWVSAGVEPASASYRGPELWTAWKRKHAGVKIALEAVRVYSLALEERTRAQKAEARRRHRRRRKPTARVSVDRHSVVVATMERMERSRTLRGARGPLGKDTRECLVCCKTACYCQQFGRPACECLTVKRFCHGGECGRD